MIEGATQQPRGDGVRAGKGLLEHIEVLPLLAEEALGIGPPPLASARVPPGEHPAAAERSDADRRAERSWRGVPPALLRVGALFLLAFLVVCLVATAIARATRALARL